jgi:hypothetical protein
MFLIKLNRQSLIHDELNFSNQLYLFKNHSNYPAITNMPIIKLSYPNKKYLILAIYMVNNFYPLSLLIIMGLSKILKLVTFCQENFDKGWL